MSCKVIIIMVTIQTAHGQDGEMVNKQSDAHPPAVSSVI